MKLEKSTTVVLGLDDKTGQFEKLQEGFHDEFDALEWAENNVKASKVIITTSRVFVLH